MANENIMGVEVPFGPIDVTDDTITTFGKGINDELKLHSDPAAEGFCAHPMYCAVIVIPGTGAVLFQPGAQFNLNRIVHGGIDINFHHPIKPGDKLSQSSKLVAIEEKSGGGSLIIIDYQAVNQDGRQMVDGRTRYFVRGKKKDGEGSEAEAAPEPEAPIGAPLFEAEIPTLDNQSLLYAEGSGDRFPIHTDDGFAKSVGLPGMIMHGMCTLALSVGSIIEHGLEGDSSRLLSVGCKFTSMVLPGETLRIAATRDDNGKIYFTTYNAAGDKAVSEGVAGVN